MIHAWQVLLGISAGAHVVAFLAGLRAIQRYPAWLAMLLLSACAIATWDPTDPVSPLLYLLLLFRLGSALEAAIWLRASIPEGGGWALAMFCASVAVLVAYLMAAVYPGWSDMRYYLLMRGAVHTALALIGVGFVLITWTAELPVDRHALILSLYLAKFSAAQLAAGWIATTGAWMLVDMASSAANVALLLWWSLWVSRPARHRLA